MIEDKFFNSDEELNDLAKICDEEFEMALIEEHHQKSYRLKNPNAEKFVKEVTEIISKQFDKNVDDDTDATNSILEVSSKRQKYNIQMNEFYFYLIQVLLSLSVSGD